VQVDYVGSLENAGTVISRLHQGEKRLVFCDSRSRVEKLASQLRGAGVETHVSHSSLSVDERHRSETAFAQSSNCVIVATSTLELGIDVGDLDRVIQIDSPTTVSSFLQRLGRTGRRSGNSRNCLFLATHPDALLRAIAILGLWKKGFVEPVEPPPVPYHVFAQQILALTLQERGLGRNAWPEWLSRLSPFKETTENQLAEILDYMIREEYLSEDQGILFVGKEGESRFGFQNFLDLFSIFMKEPEFQVYFGREHLGSVDRGSFATRGETDPVISLAGRSWKLREMDWNGSKVFVEPAEYGGKSRWLGSGRAYSFELCQEVKQILASETRFSFLSHRGEEALDEARRDHDWLKPDASVLRKGARDESEWWTFIGRKANAQLGKLLIEHATLQNSADNFSLRFRMAVSSENLVEAVNVLRTTIKDKMTTIDENPEELKFSECLPASALRRMSHERQKAVRPVEFVLAQPLHISNSPKE
jgi:ATP-dependent Lhr-like helicase